METKFDYEIEIVEEKSRFIGLVKVDFKDIDDIKDIIKTLKKEYKKSRHVCYAYKTKIDGVEFKRYSDDGEPGGTAGIPILSVIESNEVENVLVVVVRYFGGKKLGASKLLRTYRKAANEAIHSIDK